MQVQQVFASSNSNEGQVRMDTLRICCGSTSGSKKCLSNVDAAWSFINCQFFETSQENNIVEINPHFLKELAVLTEDDSHLFTMFGSRDNFIILIDHLLNVRSYLDGLNSFMREASKTSSGSFLGDLKMNKHWSRLNIEIFDYSISYVQPFLMFLHS